ncbi:ImmA/IrrE family metallo-endopeptidase [Ramlibacter sp. AW1]|uniref:ImmA/IrrE family metallo-endopeptidase n=1 Tax=Ramlibacter aurantiacus TaxID=2801330 RepID=A0A936ZLH9_9BURK|nr:ImmA/IrrE family metallo-endopeptidase [Ramlibacter aurantiacus]MBL0422398.1 ImmA/IrrE family metallo-endopeptidase [Ramlibacter aurantiacus]
MFSATRLALARQRRQLTKKELAELAGLSIPTLTRLDGGKTEPSRETVLALARALNFPFEFFYQNECEVLRPEAVSFRSLSTLSARQRDAALAAGSFAFEVHDWIAERFELPKPHLLNLRDEDPVVAAETLRSHWGIGTQPVEHMIKLLESKGVRVFVLAEQHKNVDAFSCWHKEVPFVFLNTFKSAERSRFDAAHEVAHLCLHLHGQTALDRNLEREADSFASAFLIQQSDLIAYVPRQPSLSQLLSIKKRWGVSVSALARRAHDAKLISDWHYESLSKQISYLGYRSKEPEGRAREKSVLWRMVFDELWKDGLTRDSIARSLHLPPDEVELLIGELLVQQPIKPVRERPALRVI